MGNEFYDFCYEILSHYLHFQDVADTYKSIKQGLFYRDNYPQNMTDFNMKQNDIISYIITVRKGNIIDAYQVKENPFLFIPSPLGKKLYQLSPDELYNELVLEITRLLLKGIHQTIKHINSTINDNQLTKELLQQDIDVLRKYGVMK